MWDQIEITPTNDTESFIENIKDALDGIQKNCNARTLRLDEVLEYCYSIHGFLTMNPKGTVVKGGLHARLPNSYKYTADATFVWGKKNSKGKITIYLLRCANGFGSNNYSIIPPDGYTVKGGRSVMKLSDVKIIKKSAP